VSVAEAIRIADALAELGASLLDPRLDVSSVGDLLTRREELIWSLQAECAVDALADATPLERERLAVLLRGTAAQDERLRISFESRRQEALMELAASARHPAAEAAPAPRSTERVA